MYAKITFWGRVQVVVEIFQSDPISLFPLHVQESPSLELYTTGQQHSPLKSRSPSLNLFFAQHYFCNYSTTEATVLENIKIYVYSNVKRARLKVLI